MFANILRLLVLVLTAGIPATLFAQVGQPNLDLRILPIEGTEEVPNAAALQERKVVMQVQDISRGPLSGAEVTFILPENGDAGSFANGSKVERVVTDRDGVVTVRIRPQKKKFSFRVEASYQNVRTTSVISIGGAQGSSMKKIVIGGVIGAAAVIGALVATGGHTSGPTGPVTSTISAGPPSVGPPQ
jgi:hypothetical protein